MRLYFCSDIHASRKCWKKFLNSASFYGADHIIVGGDITGKFVVPIVERAGGIKTATFLGVERRIETHEQLVQLTNWIADAGQYAFQTTPDEQAWYAEDQARVDELFKKLAMERVDEWVETADEMLSGSGVRVFVSAANDDFLEVDEALARSELIEDPNGKVIALDDGFQILGMGWGNITPWACPRDIPEDQLAKRIEVLADSLADPSKTIFNLHVPPLDSGLDIAPLLDSDLRLSLNGSGIEMVPVGSSATREAISRYQPLLGLHGHIHESRGIKKIAGVPVANPGSEYGEGILDGVIIDIDKRKGIKNIRLVTG
jgi:Icc-related predicted phosphoesterase